MLGDGGVANMKQICCRCHEHLFIISYITCEYSVRNNNAINTSRKYRSVGQIYLLHIVHVFYWFLCPEQITTNVFEILQRGAVHGLSASNSHGRHPVSCPPGLKFTFLLLVFLIHIIYETHAWNKKTNKQPKMIFKSGIRARTFAICAPFYGLMYEV